MSADSASPVGGMFLPVVTLVLVVCWAYAPRWFRQLRYRNLPPGPFCLPFLGYLPMFDKNTAHVRLAELAKKYGSVFGIQVGGKYVVVLSDMQALKESYNREEFLDRPDKLLLLPGEQPFVLSLNGVAWKDQRRFLVSSFRKLGVGTEEHQDTIMEEISEVCASLAKSEGVDVNLEHEFELAINNVIFRLVYGKRFEKDHPMIRLQSEYNDCFKLYLLHKLLTYFFPSLGKVFGLNPQVKRTAKTCALRDDILRKEIAEHEVSLNSSRPKDLLDLSLLQLDKINADHIYKREKVLLGMGNGVLATGSEATRTLLVWFILLMARYPEVQRRAQAEIDSVLGPDYKARLSQRPQLPYTEATLWETMRFRNFLHFNVNRCTSRDTTLHGFDIPRGTLILHNMHAQFRNPELFPRPEEFDPNRFLAQDGRTVHVPEHFVPFSYGKRNCVGDKMATNTLLLFATTLLQHFDVLPPEGGVSLDVKVVFVNEATKPYARFRTRNRK